MDNKIFCIYCGNPMNEGDQFCGKCGKENAQGQQWQKEQSYEQPSAQPPKRSGSKKGLIIAIIAVAAAIILAAGAVFVYFSARGNALKKEINENYSAIADNGIPYYTDRAAAALGTLDDMGFFDLKKKQALSDELSSIYAASNQSFATLEDASAFARQKRASLDELNIDPAAFAAYEEALTAYEDAISSKDLNEVDIAATGLQKAEDALRAANEEYVRSMLDEYTQVDMSHAESEDISTYNEHFNKAAEDLSNGDLMAAYKNLIEIEPIYYGYALPETELSVSVQQMDVSDYPNIRVYLDITDASTGEVVEGLDGMLFYIRKQDANGNYVKQIVKAANQLDELEALNINMVADISGSMSGSPLNQAKNIMTDFVNSIQFEAGDRVELTSFSNGVYIECPFTDSRDAVNTSINRLVTYDMTALYDALYTSVNKVASMQGAKCVIAFTDGLDNYSNVSVNDVIALAQRYHVPVFIIGIGSSNYYDARRIAEQTGGAYYNVSSVSDMSVIYDQIYRLEKQLYMIEFEDTSGVDLYDESRIVVGYHNRDFGGETTYEYIPYTLVSVDDDLLYIDGPEGTVCAYMKNFASAMTNVDYGYISPYILSGSDMEKSQTAYVKLGIDEVLDSYEIENVAYSGSNDCVVTTRESYFVQSGTKPLRLLTQRCKYNVTRIGDKWFITGFAEDVDVLSDIQYSR